MFLRSLFLRFLGLNDVNRRINYLRKNGAYIGEHTNFYGDVNLDMGFPYMLHIGSYCEITDKVTILCHDYSWAVIKRLNGHLVGGVNSVFIDDNVFIGNGAIILMNTHIGKNSIVAAGSVVTGNFPDNVVIAGVPGKAVSSIEDYYQKRVKRQYGEAANMVRCYRNAFHEEPTKDKLPAYFYLYEDRNKPITEEIFLQRLKLKDNYQESLQMFQNIKPMFESFEAFLKSVK